jgi:hypothetical protein
VSFDLPSLLIGLIPGMIIGHCTRCRFTCPNGDQGKGGFWCRCNDRALKDALKPDANFDASAGVSPEKAQRIYDNVTDDPSYQELVAELAKECTCTPPGNRPCDSLLAGGLCDDLHLGEREACDGFDEDEPDNL